MNKYIPFHLTGTCKVNRAGVVVVALQVENLDGGNAYMGDGGSSTSIIIEEISPMQS